ncbi:hypothetical protein Tco_0873573 [Tanacetum coccineum]|uniref:DUF4283 domain-containing protein n=1 Tax=Tanacetum coccineum TaxID=301880 RepID=A0ABQ5BM30_9ASTR
MMVKLSVTIELKKGMEDRGGVMKENETIDLLSQKKETMELGTDKTNEVETLYQSLKAHALASKVKSLPRQYTTVQELFKDVSSSKDSNPKEGDKVVDQSVEKPSFASVVHDKPSKKLVKIKEMSSEETVNGAAVALPIEAVEAVNARFTNTLYGMESVLENGPWLIHRVPLILNEWTLNTILKKDEIKSAPIGRPIMLDTYTSNMCLHSWGRSTYARALIEISADMELKKSLVIAIPLCNKVGHTFATIDIEYEWIPPRCESCKFFDHISTKCPKLPKVDPPVKVMDDGFIEVKKKKAKTKQNNKRQVEGVRLTKPALNLQYRRVDKGETSKAKATNTSENKESNDSGLNKHHDATIKVATMNSFSALSEEDFRVWDDENRLVNEKENLQVINESDSEEVDEYITMDEYSGPTPKKVNYDQGASTPLNDGSI